jgi:hypothetical protein
LLSPPFTSIRNEMEDIPVPATKKKSAVTKVIALFLFPSLSLSLSFSHLYLRFSLERVWSGRAEKISNWSELFLVTKGFYFFGFRDFSDEMFKIVLE